MALPPASEPGRRPLTDRQLQIALMTAQGLSAARIADQLGISVGTVQNSRSRIRRRLGLATADHLPEALGGIVEPATEGERRRLAALRQAIASVEAAADQLRRQSRQTARAQEPVAAWEAALIGQMAEELQRFRDRWIREISRSWEER
jgi:DNA-binding CsgD family transcriptional regulator